jgi:hypothetical protein
LSLLFWVEVCRATRDAQMIPAAVSEKVQAFFERPEVQAHLATAKERLATEAVRQQVVDDLYAMLPRPNTWVLSKEAFEPLVRQHVFREQSQSSTVDPPSAESA